MIRRKGAHINRYKRGTKDNKGTVKLINLKQTDNAKQFTKVLCKLVKAFLMLMSDMFMRDRQMDGQQYTIICPVIGRIKSLKEKSL